MSRPPWRAVLPLLAGCWALCLIGAGLLAAQVVTEYLLPIEGSSPDTGAPPSGASPRTARREAVRWLVHRVA